MSLVTAALDRLRAGASVRVLDSVGAASSAALVWSADAADPWPTALAGAPAILVRAKGEPSDPVAITEAVGSGGRQFVEASAQGVLARKGLEEAALDLVRLSGRGGGAWMLREDDGSARTARGPGGEDALTLSVADVHRHRMATEIHVVEIARAALPSAYASAGFSARAFRDLIDGVEHLALVKGEPEPGALVRVHSECLTGDALGSLRCDCGEQLRAALTRIGGVRSGAVIYLRGHEGRGIGLANKIRAYALQDQGLDTAEANAALGFSHDARDYGSAAQILRAIGFADIRLLSNNPLKAEALRAYGVEVREELPLALGSNPHNAGYLQTKRDKMGHRLPADAAPSTRPAVAER